MFISLPAPVEAALSKLLTSGFEAYAVGGCVRDSLLGRRPEDWDITTSALPDEIMTVFADCKTVPTGLKHGTVTVIMQGMPLEITTYRTDGNYSDGRHPDSVSFTADLREDLRRRDFTVNAMAYHPQEGLVDFFGGVTDLQERRIACVGDPIQRFGEDALRILRALRFSSALGFGISAPTADAVHRLSPLLHRVSAERISVELIKLLRGRDVQRVLAEYKDVTCELFPTLSVDEQTPKTVAAVENTAVLRLAALLQGCSYEDARNIIEHLRLDNNTANTLLLLMANKNMSLCLDDRQLKRLLYKFGEVALLLAELQRARAAAFNKDEKQVMLRDIRKQLEVIVQSNACYRLNDLAINGNDLLELGVSAGPPMGELLQVLLEAVMDDICPNERAALLQYAKDRL